MVLNFGLFVAVIPPAQTPARATSIEGTWTLDKDRSDAPPNTRAPADDPERPGVRGRGDAFGPRGGRGRGGRGPGGQGPNGGDTAVITIAAGRALREALTQVVTPPDQLTISVADTMVIVVGPGGRTTRLLPDGRKIKEENSGIERRTKWMGDTLVSELTAVGLDTALGLEKITETYSVDAASRQLQVTVRLDYARSTRKRTLTQVYNR